MTRVLKRNNNHLSEGFHFFFVTLVKLTKVRLEQQSQNHVDVSYGNTFALGA